MRLLIAVTLAALAATPALARTEHRQLPRTDGSTIAYSVDTPSGPIDGVLVLAQGSGCQPTAGNANLNAVRQAFPHHLAVMVEKYGIASDAAIADGFTDCPPAFHAGHTVKQRVADYVAVLADLRSAGAGRVDLRSPCWPRSPGRPRRSCCPRPPVFHSPRWC